MNRFFGGKKSAILTTFINRMNHQRKQFTAYNLYSFLILSLKIIHINVSYRYCGICGSIGTSQFFHLCEILLA